MRTKFFFYINSEKRKKIRRSFVSVLICVSMSLSIFITKQRIYPLAVSMAKSNASQKATLLVNKTVLEILQNKNIAYNDIIEIKRAESGEIVSLETNTYNVNKLKSTLAYNVQSGVSKISDTDIGIPIGNLTGSIILTGRGPKIPVKLASVGDINIDMYDEFITAGINQTKHKIDVNISLSISVALPDSIEDVDVKTRVPVAETVIVGKVPAMYMGK